MDLDGATMSDTSPLRGLAQVNISAENVADARDWYARFLGVEPYFQRPDAEHPAYVECRLGDYEHELGIIDRGYLPPVGSGQPGGAIVRWHVDDLTVTLDRLIGLGATGYEPATERGEGFVTASVVDPFGNILGLIHSPHYLRALKIDSQRS
jgi:predicted enzyme related to lactoylglutathione lyase